MRNLETDSEVYEDLRRLLLWDTFPCITQADVDWLFARIRRPDQVRVPPDQHRFWEAAKAKVVGDTVVPDPRPFTYDGEVYTLGAVNYFTATVAGTTGSTQPDWTTAPAIGDTVTDGLAVVWRNTGVALWTPTWDLAWGLHRGWKLKAQQTVAQYDIKAGGQELKRSQIIANCLSIADEWGKVLQGNWRQVRLSGSLKTQMIRFPLTNRSPSADFIDAFFAREDFYPGYGYMPGVGRYEDW